MKNSEKSELRNEVYRLKLAGYSKKEGIKILKDYGYCDSTARMYWKCFAISGSDVSEVKNEI